MPTPDECCLIESTDPLWMNYLCSTPQANIFHHPAWCGVLAACYGYRPFVLVALDRSGRITAGIPLMEVKSPLRGKRWVSLPFSDYCNPLFEDGADLDKLLSWLVQERQARRVKQVEIRWGLAETEGVFQDTHFIRQAIPLDPDPELVSKRFERVHRQNAQAASKRGVRLEWGNEIKHIDLYYGLQLETRRRQGVPAQPYRYFHTLAAHLFEPGLASVLLAYKDDECIAGLVLLHWGNSVVAKYAASKEDQWNLRPNNLLFWSGIRWACENGYAFFDMGRTEIDNPGLRRYKKGWGAKEEPLAYSSIGAHSSLPSNGSLSKALSYVIRHTPSAVCKATGELLYKHVA